MAFVKATIQIKPASVGTGIKCGLRRGKSSAASLSLFINVVAAAALNIADGDKIEIMLGDGEHHGLLRLRKNNSAGEATASEKKTLKGKFFVVKLGHQPMFVDRTEPSAWCQWEQVEDGWCELVLPKWADETAPRKAKPEAPKIPLSQPVVAASMPKRSVTASVMGDPPPGRREMLEKIGNFKS
jgi:hypothetical protein